MAIRSVHEQVTRLVSKPEQEEIGLAEVFAPFAGQNPLQYNPYTEPLWKAAVAQYNRSVAPVEKRIAGKLRNQFRGLEDNPQQVSDKACNSVRIKLVDLDSFIRTQEFASNCYTFWISLLVIINNK